MNDNNFSLKWNERLCVWITFPIVLCIALIILAIAMTIFVAARILDFIGVINAIIYQLKMIKNRIKSFK